MNQEEFSAFRHEAVHALMELNEQADREYHIDVWPRWDYELEDGTLVFSEEGVPKVIASIQVVGTTSVEAKTWMWSWANEHLPANVVDRIRDVRKYGGSERVAELTESVLPDDEYLGWAMTAIAARILGAKGGYRFPVEDGFIYMVYTDLRFASEDDRDAAARAQNEKKKTVDCDKHGKAFSTYVCEHLAANPRQEWFSREPEASNPWPDAWCAKCDEIFQEQGEWNKKNEGRMKIALLCHYCYESKRKMATPD